MKQMKKLGLVIFSIQVIWTSSLCAQAGKLDKEFGGGDGLVVTSFFSQQPAEGFGIAVHPEGRIMVSGYTRAADHREHAALACYRPDGSLDTHFNGSGKIVISADTTDSDSWTLAIQPDGKVVMAAVLYTEVASWIGVYRYLADGSPDITFDQDGFVLTSLGTEYLGLNAIALQPDGKILVGGYVGHSNENFDRFYVARYLADGMLDKSFDGDGIAITTVGESYTGIRSLLIQPDSKIIAAGYGVFNNYYAFAAVRYNTNGSVDHSFGVEGIAIARFGDADAKCMSAALQPDGKIVLGGFAFSSLTGFTEFAAARLNMAGTLDNSFHGDGMATITVSGNADQSRTLLLQPDGKIWLGGYAHSNINGGSDMALVRLHSNGIPDDSFDGDGVKVYEDDLNTSSTMNSIAFQPDGKIVGTGFVRKDGLNSMRIMRIISGLTVSNEDPYIQDIRLSVYPNPVVKDVTLTYELQQAETISIRLCDVHGRVIQELMSRSERFSGIHTEQLTIENQVPPGNYFISIQFGSRIQSVQIVVE